MKSSPDELVQQFIDGTLDPDEERDALRRIASDPEARELLRFERKAGQALSSQDSPPVPPGFSDRVMQRVQRSAAHEAGSPVWDSLTAIWDALARPRPLTWRPVYALPVLAALAAVYFLTGDPAQPAPESGSTAVETTETRTASAHQVDEGPVLVRFMYVDEDAESVAVAGDFNHWEPVSLTPKEADGRTVWTGMMAVPPGDHRYMYVLDGDEWVTDPLAPQAQDDGFGHSNAILSL